MSLTLPEIPAPPPAKRTQKGSARLASEAKLAADEKLDRTYALIFQKREFFCLPYERERLEAYEEGRLGCPVEYCEEEGVWPLLCGTPELEERLGKDNQYPTGQLRALASQDYEPGDEIYEYKGRFTDITEEDLEPEKDHYNFYLKIGTKKIRIDANNYLFAARYINQTLQPNTEFRLKYDAQGKPRLVVVANVKIKCLQELGISYGDKNFKADPIERTSLAEIFLSSIRGSTAVEIRQLEEKVMSKLDKLDGSFSSYVLEVLQNPYLPAISNRHRQQSITWSGICEIYDWIVPQPLSIAKPTTVLVDHSSHFSLGEGGIIVPKQLDGLHTEKYLAMFNTLNKQMATLGLQTIPARTLQPKDLQQAIIQNIDEINKLIGIENDYPSWIQHIKKLRDDQRSTENLLQEGKRAIISLCKKFYAFGLEPSGPPVAIVRERPVSIDEQVAQKAYEALYQSSKNVFIWLNLISNSAVRIVSLTSSLAQILKVPINEHNHRSCLTEMDEIIFSMIEYMKEVPAKLHEQRIWIDALQREYDSVMACRHTLESGEDARLVVYSTTEHRGGKRISDVVEGYKKAKSVAASGLFSTGVDRDAQRNLLIYMRSFERDLEVLKEASLQQGNLMLGVFTDSYRFTLLRALKSNDEYNVDVSFHHSLLNQQLKYHFSLLSRSERKIFREDFLKRRAGAVAAKPDAERLRTDTSDSEQSLLPKPFSN